MSDTANNIIAGFLFCVLLGLAVVGEAARWDWDWNCVVVPCVKVKP